MSKFISEGAASQFDAMVTAAQAHITGLDTAKLRNDLEKRYAEVARENADKIVNERDAFLLGVCGLVLAGRDVLRGVCHDDETIMTILREAFVEPRRAHVHEWLNQRLDITRDEPDAAFQNAAKNFKSGGEAYFGDSFEYRQAVQTDEQSIINVHRCFFNSFFRANDAAELTPLFCALDIVWADELNDGPYNVRFERTSILSAGDDCCSFRFYRDEAKAKQQGSERTS